MHALEGKCQICLTAAAHVVEDVVAVGWSESDIDLPSINFERAGRHWFCDEHHRLPRKYNMLEIERAYDASRKVETAT